MVTNPEQLLELLSDANPWWEEREVPAGLALPYRRRDFFVIRRELDQRPILALTGPRQVGKTTVVYQLIRDLLARGVEPNRILYLSFDTPGLRQVSSAPLNDAIRTYEERVLRTPFRSASGIVYVFLDEITKVSDWHRDLKGWYDFRYPVRYLITSSSNSELRLGSAESLVGRVSTHLLLTWKFVDVVSLRTGDSRTNDGYLEARNELAPAIEGKGPQRLYERLKEVRPKSARGRITIQNVLDWYLLVDGYPELIQSDDLRYCAKRLDEYVKLTLTHDLYRFHRIRSSTRTLEDLLALIAGQSGDLANYRKLSEPLGLDQRTIVEYLDYLEDAYIISRGYFYSKRRDTRLRKLRKIYIPNPALLQVLRGRVDRSTSRNPIEMGHIVESVVHGYAKRLAFNLSPGPSPMVYYWRDRHDHEVDVVIEYSGHPLPIEVKYRTDPKHDLEGMRHFIDEKGTKFGIVVTRDLLEYVPPILFLPLADFLMLA